MTPGAIIAAAPEAGNTKGDTVTTSKRPDAEAALQAAIARFRARNPRSEELHVQALESMPGGNTRAQMYTYPFPVCMKSGRGYQVTSEDGHTYTDMVGELTAGLYGHSHPVIQAAIQQTMDKVGLNLGATIAQEHVHAAAVCARFGLERVRFANSGTEANLHALAAARAFAGGSNGNDDGNHKKRKVVVFSGGYHGGVLTFPGGRPAPNTVDREDWVVVARFNEPGSARAAIAGPGVAAVLVEGMQGGGGAIPATREFLEAVETSAKENGVIFILDEVMTSRLAPGGLAELYQLRPDLKTLGKYLGGGLAFGAFGGRADIMSVYDPRPHPQSSSSSSSSITTAAPAAIAHHGTFNNNTLAMYAGHAGLTQAYTPEACTALNAQGDWLRAELAAVTQGTKMCFTGLGAIVGSHFTAGGGLQALPGGGGGGGDDADEDEDWTLKQLFWFEMMEDGFWLTRRGLYSLVLGTPRAELARFVDRVAAFLERHRGLVRVGGT